MLSAINLLKLFYQIKSSGLTFFLPPDLSLNFTQQVIPRSFTRLYSMSYAIELHHNSDVMHCQSSEYKICQSNQIKLFLYQIFCQLLLIINTLEHHQYYHFFLQQSEANNREPCFAAFSVLCILALSQRFLGHSAYILKRSHILPTQASSQASFIL